MKRRFFVIIGTLTFAAVVFSNLGLLTGNSLLSLIPDSGLVYARENGTSKVVFKVKCYDEGKSALQGLKGIKKIGTGFHYIHETDTVYFDPTVITVEEMEAALKKAGTYVETIKEIRRN